MAKLYYGDGKCSIEGSGVRFVMIRYRGAILIDDKTSEGFIIVARKNNIVIGSINPDAGVLNNLFEYRGEFKVLSVKIYDGVEKSSASIHRVMDYSELLTGNSEDMTTNSEDLKATHISGSRVGKTKLKQPYLKNLDTSDGSLFYKANGDKYSGYYHMSLEDLTVMTGGDREDNSQLLYIKQTDGNLVSTFNPTGIPPGIKVRKKQERSKKVSQNRSKKISRGRSY